MFEFEKQHIFAFIYLKRLETLWDRSDRGANMDLLFFLLGPGKIKRRKCFFCWEICLIKYMYQMSNVLLYCHSLSSFYPYQPVLRLNTRKIPQSCFSHFPPELSSSHETLYVFQL